MNSAHPRAENRFLERFDRRYPQIILAGLSACIWFSSFAQAAHDLWAACWVFALLTALALLLLIGHARTGRAIKLPLAGAVLIILGAFVVSSRYSFDIENSRFESWVWFFSFLGFYLLINTVETPSSIDSFFGVNGLVLIPLAAYCLYLRWSDLTPEIHANLINSIVLSGFALYWVFFLWEKQRQKDLGGHLALLSCGILLLLGRSWWAWVSLALGFKYYYKESIKNIHKKKEYALTFYSITAVILLIGALLFKSRHCPQPGYLDSNRLSWWMAALRMAWKHPLVGVGLGSYATAYPYFRVGRGLNTLFAHNFPLQMLAETGTFGVLAIGWFIRCMVPRARGKGNVYAATLITILCYSLVHINMEYFLNKMLLLFILAAWIEPRPADLVLARGRAITTAALALLLFVPSWLIPWAASTHLVEGQRLEELNTWGLAKSEYLKALDLDPACADAYAGLARVSELAFHGHGSTADLELARAYWLQAYQRKKSVIYLSHLVQPPR